MPFAIWNNCCHCAWALCSFFSIWLPTSLNKIQRPNKCIQWLLYVFGKSRNANSHSILSWLLNSEKGEGKKPFRQDSIKHQLSLELSIPVKQGKHKCHPLLKYFALPLTFLFQACFPFLGTGSCNDKSRDFLENKMLAEILLWDAWLTLPHFPHFSEKPGSWKIGRRGQWKLLRPCACLSSPGREVSK